MKKVMYGLYAGCAAAVVILFFLYVVSPRLAIVRENGREQIEHAQVMQPQTEMTAGPNGTENYVFLMDESWMNGGHLIFYAIHQDVRVMLANKTIYKITRNYRNAFGKSPGGVWVDVPIWKDYIGQELMIEITPVYSSSRGYTPIFYVGKRSDVYEQLFADTWPTILISCLCIVIGMACCAFILMNRKNPELDKNPVYIGLFSILIGTWKLTDMGVIKLLAADWPGIYILPFVCLALMPVPVCLYFKQLCKKGREAAIWNVLFLVCEIQCGAILLLQYFNILDFKETLVSTWVAIVLGLLTMVCVSCQDIRYSGFTRKIRINLICLSLCTIGTIVDIITYSTGHMVKSSNYGITCFLVYILVVCIGIGKQSLELAGAERQTSLYEEQAFHDKLTGLYNRTALETDLQMLDYVDTRALIVTFDLNNLKKVNDTYGHERGDTYIKDSAEIISRCFASLGKIYRCGGDEFYCLSKKSGPDECKRAIALLRECCADYNVDQKDKHIDMNIAVGYAMYDRRLDYSFTDTMERADKLMYENKAKLKLQDV